MFHDPRKTCLKTFIDPDLRHLLIYTENLEHEGTKLRIQVENILRKEETNFSLQYPFLLFLRSHQHTIFEDSVRKGKLLIIMKHFFFPFIMISSAIDFQI